MNSLDRGRKLFFAIFTISGFSGLIYESIWSHYLKLFLGHAAYAQTLVLAIFMGGMAVGSWLMAKHSTRVRNLLIGYAIVEGVIGLLGLVFHSTSIAVTSWAFDSLLPNLDSAAVAQAAKWTLGALLILPQSILLGMTFPLMSGAIVRRYPQRSGETLAMLYFTNSLGAAVGVLVSGFVLIGAVGLPGTIMTAGLLNVALALTVWGIVKYQPDSVQPALVVPAAAAEAKSSSVLRWMLIGAAVTGAAAFLYEIAWIRMLSLVLGGTTHSFELMLSAFILGIALGGLWVHRRIDGLRDPVRFLGKVLMIMAFVALLSLPVYNATFDMMSSAFFMFTPTQQGYVGFNLASHSIAMLVMIPTTFFCGMTLPIMTHVLIRSGTGERAIGAVYAWNTAGAILGVVLAVHVLMPIIGVKGVVLCGALLHMLLGVFYLSRSAAPAATFKLASWPAVIGGAAVLATAGFVDLDPTKLSSGVYRHGQARQVDAKVLYLKHGKTASISLIEVDGITSIATNGKPDAGIAMHADIPSQDEITMVMAAALPIALHPKPERVANIGIGSGLTSQVLLTSDVVREVDTVEIEPFMAQAAEIGFMPRVAKTFHDPRSHIYFEDAKTFFAIHRKKYDVIVSEPSNPWVSGVATLFSDEFYSQMTRYLQPNGMLVQWVQIYETDLDIILSIIKALAPHFEDFAVYNADDTNLLIVAVRSGELPRPDARVFASAGMRAELARVGIETIQHLQSRYLGNKRLLLPLLQASGVPANSDYFPFVDLNAPRARILKQNAGQLSGLGILAVPFLELLTGVEQVRERTTFSPNAYSRRDALVGQATALRDAWETSKDDHLSAHAARTFLTLYSSREECQKPAIQRAWLDSAYYMAAETNVALGSNELRAIWDRLSATPCAGQLSPRAGEMFSLLRAVAMRDVNSVASKGGALLASDYKFDDTDQLALALIATAASNIAIDKPAEAAALIEKNAQRTPQTASQALALRWIAAIAAARVQTESEREALAKAQ
ncbi:MAG TPA: fused MFS/spermidine synthase [Steroidobacteraceae bacterium]|nr:fused MFS/spermidine synthase [Steroidobacteraceae bacterium]